MEWTTEHDILLGREILVVEPYTAKPRTFLKGQLWNKISENLNKLEEPKFVIVQRSVRDRFKLLREKFKKRMTAEERATGISPEMSELDAIMEEIIELEDSYTEEHINGSMEKMRKEQEDKENANDIRLKAMETLRETQKRKADSGMEDEKKIKQRSRRSEAVHYLRERMESDKQLREKELDIRKKEVEIEAIKQENEGRRHKEFIQMMQLQNQQMQQMQVNYVSKAKYSWL